ncbi:MAG TPA: hypothetical protein PLP17_11020, partial [Oligoflexia bacterium]|nr:hypothetical protein [Oligoflexia bacterium]
QPDSLASPAAILDASSPAYQALGHAQRAVDTAPSWPAAEGQELTEDETEARLTLLDERVEPLTLVERAELYSALVRHNMLELLSQNDLLRLEECAELQRLIEDSSAVPPPSLEARARLSMRLHALEGDLIGKTLKQDDLRYLTACEHVYMLGQTQQELALSGRAEELIAALCYLDEEAFKDVSALAQDIAVRGEEALAEILTAADALRYFASPERFDGLARARLMDRIAAMPKAPFGIDLTEVLPDESTPAFQALLEAQSLLRLAETTNQGPAPFSQADIEAILAEYTDPQAQQAARQILYHMSKYTDIGGTRQERLQLSSTEPVLYDVPTSGLLALRLDLVRMGKIRAGKVEAGQSAGATLYTPGTGTVGDCLAYLNNRRQLGGSGLQPHAHRHMDIPTTTDITQADYVLVDDAILHRLETDAEFARAVIENNIELVIPRGYAAGFRAGNLPGTAAQVRDRLGAAMARYQDAAAKHDTALANSRETLATRLEHLIESNASAQARFAKQLIQPLLDIAAEDAAANGISLKLALERLVNDRSRLIAAFNKLNDTDYDSSSKLPPAALGDFRNAVNLLSSAQGKAQDNAAAL